MTTYGAEAVNEGAGTRFGHVARKLRNLADRRSTHFVAAIALVAFFTASVFQDQRDEILAGGLDDFLGKPFASEAIYACLERHLGTRFVRAESGSVAPPPCRRDETRLDRGALAGLNHGLQEDLAAALVDLDTTRIARVVDRVFEENPALGTILRHYAGRLEYSAILQAVKKC